MSDMSDHKIAGACTSCGTMCFDVLAVHDSHEQYPGEPKQIGAPHEGAKRVFFRLFDGSVMQLTFCNECNPEYSQYADIWHKVMRTWLREKDGHASADIGRQFNNGILCEIGRDNWLDVMQEGR